VLQRVRQRVTGSVVYKQQETCGCNNRFELKDHCSYLIVFYEIAVVEFDGFQVRSSAILSKQSFIYT